MPIWCRQEVQRQRDTHLSWVLVTGCRKSNSRCIPNAVISGVPAIGDPNAAEVGFCFFVLRYRSTYSLSRSWSWCPGSRLLKGSYSTLPSYFLRINPYTCLHAPRPIFVKIARMFQQSLPECRRGSKLFNAEKTNIVVPSVVPRPPHQQHRTTAVEVSL